MSLQGQIQSAIAAHAAWKQHLRSAIDKASSEFVVADVCRDDACVFGKWLHGLDQQSQATHRWRCVRVAHADFHKEAARILELALAGERKTANAAFSYSSRFTGLSAKLTAELTAWKRESLG